MVSSVSLNVQNAWAAREARGEDQSKQEVAQTLFPEGTNNKVDVSGTNLTNVNNQITQAEGDLENLKANKADTDAKIEKIQKEVDELKEKITAKIDEAIKAANKYTEEQQDKIKNITNSVLEEYYSGAITKEEMQEKLSSQLGEIDPDLPAEVQSILKSAESLMNELMAKTQLLTELKTISDCFAKQITCKETQIANLNEQKEELERQEAEKKKCDPIGFVTEDGKICDFIIDRNGDGKFNNETEFLGAENNWNEMIQLDSFGNNDGKVSAEEMKNSGVKVLVTDADGKQSIVDVESLGIDEIDLSTYKQGNEQIGNGNEVLGVFGITINGKTTNDGYNTLDTVDWLDKNYSNMFTDKSERKGRFNNEKGLSEKQPGVVNYSQDFKDVFTLRQNLFDTNKSFLSQANSLKETLEEAEGTTPSSEVEDPEKKKEKEEV